MIYDIDYDVPKNRVLLDGGAIRYARKSQNMTAKDLADAAKISHGQLSNIEQMKIAPLKSVAQRIRGLRARKHRIRRVLKDYDIERPDARWQNIHPRSIDVLNWKKTPRPDYYVNDLEGAFDGKRRHWTW